MEYTVGGNVTTLWQIKTMAISDLKHNFNNKDHFDTGIGLSAVSVMTLKIGVPCINGETYFSFIFLNLNHNEYVPYVPYTIYNHV